MTHPAIINMLRRYDLSMAHSSYDALREILQEIVLVALYDILLGFTLTLAKYISLKGMPL